MGKKKDVETIISKRDISKLPDISQKKGIRKYLFRRTIKHNWYDGYKYLMTLSYYRYLYSEYLKKKYEKIKIPLKELIVDYKYVKHWIQKKYIFSKGVSIWDMGYSASIIESKVESELKDKKMLILDLKSLEKDYKVNIQHYKNKIDKAIDSNNISKLTQMIKDRSMIKYVISKILCRDAYFIFENLSIKKNFLKEINNKKILDSLTYIYWECYLKNYAKIGSKFKVNITDENASPIKNFYDKWEKRYKGEKCIRLKQLFKLVKECRKEQTICKEKEIVVENIELKNTRRNRLRKRIKHEWKRIKFLEIMDDILWFGDEEIIDFTANSLMIYFPSRQQQFIQEAIKNEFAEKIFLVILNHDKNNWKFILRNLDKLKKSTEVIKYICEKLTTPKEIKQQLADESISIKDFDSVVYLLKNNILDYNQILLCQRELLKLHINKINLLKMKVPEELLKETEQVYDFFRIYFGELETKLIVEYVY